MPAALPKHVFRPLAASAFLALGGCVTPMDLAYDAYVQSQITPENVGATPAQYRGYDCVSLANFAKTMADERDAGPSSKGVEKRVWQWHVDAINQVRAEKACADAPAAATAGAGLVVPGQNVIGIRMTAVTPSLATALGLDAPKGALVVEPIKGLPADKAGIKAMDVILEVAGQPITSPQDLSNLVGRMRAGYKAEVQVWRDRSRKTFTVEVAPASQMTDAPAAKPAAGPIVYSYCFYTDVPLRKHWTSNVFELASAPGVDQTTAMGTEFYRFLSARNKLTPNGQAYCQIFDNRAQAEGQWDQTRKLYRLHTVQNNEVAWAPGR